MPPQNNTHTTNGSANSQQNNNTQSNQNPTNNQPNNQNPNQVSPTPTPQNNPPQQQTNTSDPNANLTSKVHPEGFATQWRRTKCMVCGYVHEGNKVLKKCPKCGNADPDKLRETD